MLTFLVVFWPFLAAADGFFCNVTQLLLSSLLRATSTLRAELDIEAVERAGAAAKRDTYCCGHGEDVSSIATQRN